MSLARRSSLGGGQMCMWEMSIVSSSNSLDLDLRVGLGYRTKNQSHGRREYLGSKMLQTYVLFRSYNDLRIRNPQALCLYFVGGRFIRSPYKV